MTEVLSQDEIDQLLSSIEEIDTLVDDETLHSSGNESLVQKKIQLYDFRHPDRFSKEQLRTIEIMHETFARLVTNNLSNQLRTLVSVQIASVSQITYEEFVKTVSNPTLFSVIDMRPFSGSAIIEISPSITFTIVEILFGGLGGSIFNRELTEIEQALSENIIEDMLEHFRETWKKIVSLRPHLLNIETNPNLAQVVPPNEMMLLIMCNCRINNVEGLINIAIPYITIEPIVSKLSAQTWYAVDMTSDTDERIKTRLSKSLNHVTVDVSAVFGSTQLTIKEIISLKKNDIIMLGDAKYTDPISLYVGDKEKYKVIPGKRKNRLVVKVLEKCETIESDKEDKDIFNIGIKEEFL